MSVDMRKPFRTSSYTAQNEACVEVGETADGQVVFQDSKHAFRGETSPVLGFDRSAFASLVGRVRSGALDL